MKVGLGPMEMMTDSLRLTEGVPEQMKKGEKTHRYVINCSWLIRH